MPYISISVGERSMSVDERRTNWVRRRGLLVAGVSRRPAGAASR
ncbi:hypothetical protein I549_2076 [Mycobacterium avium subsp. avium 2285 (R)]|nr:hypothetical protein I549_2076 [Mycobacterium avium subsp. avium 2285 (R)]